MKKLILIFIAVSISCMQLNAQNDWSLVNLPPDAPANSFFARMWTKDAGKLFVEVHTPAPYPMNGTSFYFYDGKWERIFHADGDCMISSLHGVANDEVFFALRNNTTNTSMLYHYDGITCIDQTFMNTTWFGNIVGEKNNLYVGVGSSMYRYDGISWQLSATLTRGIGPVCYISANEIYVLECWGHTLWNGSTWTWHESFDFCDVNTVWGMRDNTNQLTMFTAGCNNFQNGIRTWKYNETSPGSMQGSWGTKYDCTYLCDGSGSNAGYATGVWGSGPNDIYVIGHFGHSSTPAALATRIYHSDGSFPLVRMTNFDTMPLITNADNYGYLSVTGTSADDVWIAVGDKLAHKGMFITMESKTAEWQQNVETAMQVIDLPESDNVISYQFTLDYDHTKLQYVNNSLTGTISEGGTLLVNEISPGKLMVSFATTNAIHGTGDLLKLVFYPLEVGDALLTISDFLLNNTATSAGNGNILISDTTPPSAAISYSDTDGYVRFGDELIITATFSEPVAESPVPQISLAGANVIEATNMTKITETAYTFNHTVTKGDGAVTVSMANGTDTHGNPVVAIPVSAELFHVIPITYGDVDDNTYIRAYDAALVLQYSVGLEPLVNTDPLPWEIWRVETANVDGVVGLTANDASLILQYTVGLITDFSTESMLHVQKDYQADIVLSLENNEIVFRSSGELFGLNVYVNENSQQLGQPQVPDANILTAFNNSETNKAMGLATAYAPADGTILMKIPVTGFQKDEIKFDLIINNVTKSYIVNIPTGYVSTGESNIAFYPNPAHDLINISGLRERAVITVSDLSGKILIRTMSDRNQIDVSNLARGLYTITILDNNQQVTGKFVKQ